MNLIHWNVQELNILSGLNGLNAAHLVVKANEEEKGHVLEPQLVLAIARKLNFAKKMFLIHSNPFKLIVQHGLIEKMKIFPNINNFKCNL